MALLQVAAQAFDDGGLDEYWEVLAKHTEPKKDAGQDRRRGSADTDATVLDEGDGLSRILPVDSFMRRQS